MYLQEFEQQKIYKLQAGLEPVLSLDEMDLIVKMGIRGGAQRDDEVVADAMKSIRAVCGQSIQNGTLQLDTFLKALEAKYQKAVGRDRSALGFVGVEMQKGLMQSVSTVSAQPSVNGEEHV